MKAKQLAMALAIVIGLFAVNQAQAQYAEGHYGGVSLQNKLFNNQYTQPGTSSHTAGLYLAPHPVPSNVGHTYYTYEALYPHEHLYEHRRTYYNYYGGPEAFYGDPCQKHSTGGGALNKTTVVWQSSSNHYGYFPTSYTAWQKLHYRLNAKKYCLGATCGGLFGLGKGIGKGFGKGCASGNCGH